MSSSAVFVDAAAAGAGFFGAVCATLDGVAHTSRASTNANGINNRDRFM
jgi:hypothetical protein